MKILAPILLAVWLAVTGCQTGSTPSRVRQDDEGAVYLYLQPVAREAERLRSTLDGVGAVHRDGAETPLSVQLREARGGDLARQRLLAVGFLPAGEYTGFVFRTGQASLRGEAGEAALRVPEAPTRIEHRFTVRRGEASVVALALRYGEAVESGFRFQPAFSIYSPDRPSPALMGFVANRRSNDVTVFNKRSFQVFDVIATGHRPSGLAVDPRGRQLYVAVAGDDGVEVVDLLAGKIFERIRLTPGDEPVALAVTPDGATLLSANRGSNSVSLLDPEARTEIVKIGVGTGPRFITLDRAGRRAFVFNTLSNTVSVVDIAGRTVFRSIPTDPAPVAGQVNRRGDRLYVIHELTPWVTVVDTVTLAVVRKFPIRAAMEAIKVDVNTDFVYLAARREFTVGVYDPFSFAPVDFVDTGAGVAHMATDADENMLYLVAQDANRLLVRDRIRKRPVAQLDVGDEPVWVSVVGEN